MGKEVAEKHRNRFIRIGVKIAALRKMKGMSQEMLAERAGISRGLLSTIEAPGIAKGFALEILFDIADVLEVDPAELVDAARFPAMKNR